MLEVINELRKIKEMHGEEVFINEFPLSSGYHIKISNKPIQDKDILKVDRAFKADSEDLQKHYNWFRSRAFFNSLLNNDANKCVAGTKKKILSVVPSSIVFKSQSLSLDEFESYIFRYLEELDAYAKGKVDIQYYHSIFINKTRELKLFIQNCPELKIKNGDNLYLYIDEDIEIYKASYELYLNKRLFLSENTCIKVDDNVLGILSYSMSLNKSKKPTLSNNRINISFDTAEYFNLISKLGYRINYILNKYSTEQKYNIKFKDREIQIIEKYIEIQKRITISDYFIIRNDSDAVNEPKEISNYELLELIDSNFTKGALKGAIKQEIKQDKEALGNYIKYANVIFSDMSIIQIFITYNEIFHEYFYNNNEVEIINPLENLLKKIFEYNIVNSSNRKILCDKFDLLLNIMIALTNSRKEKYLNMAIDIKNIKNKLLEFKRQRCIDINDDESFYFIAAQLLQYLTSLNESANKSYQDAYEYYNLKNMEQIKRKIIDKYTKYSYKLPLHSNSFVNLVYQNVLGYSIEKRQVKNITKSNHWYYYNAGLIGENIFYLSVKKEVGNEDE
ncbi:hypothetical protein [uncultured Clostridium sp.]|uniref:hypothetical protein n=1 Tax=uncultured Clostridium sp. TaxID=59620 RepID=UPI0028E3C457|nr:hypothetical protein [uncultured Clostridium sp.]